MSDTPTYDQLSALCANERFSVMYRDGGYKVSIPNYDGGEVVVAEAFDRLQALCAQMAAALFSAKHYVVAARAQVTHDEIKVALTAYRTLSPDPQWQRVPDKEELMRLIGAEVWVESEDDRCKSEIRGLEDAATAILNRARGER